VDHTLTVDLFHENTGPSQWRNVSQLEAMLAHPSAVTKKLQAEDSTPGTFLWEWKNLIFHLSKAGGLISEGNVSSMKKREGLLLENNGITSADNTTKGTDVNKQWK
jgi:hypothetical protein